MAPGVAASKTKKEFFAHLSLTEGDEEDEILFRKMLDEAAAGRQRISQSAENLNLQYRHDPDVSPPYTYNQITETARHREILTIYQTACAETRNFYDRGQFFEGANEENWIIRWCLYHSFRYTDNRNRTRSRGRKLMSTKSTSSDDLDDDEVNAMGGVPHQTHPGSADGSWDKQRLANREDYKRQRFSQGMANNLRPRYGLPAGGFDSSRRAPAPIYTLPDRMGVPDGLHRDGVLDGNLKARPRTTYWDPARSTE